MTEIGDGRRFTMAQRVRLGDCTASGRLRLDAAARYFQDVAADDSADAALPAGRAWVLRRMEIDVTRLPGLDADLQVQTFCTGVGGRWAERTTVVRHATDPRREYLRGRAVWVSVDLRTRAPVTLAPEFFGVYGEAIRANRVSARLTHPAPPVGAVGLVWPRRSSDIDILGHINNAVYWVAIEDLLHCEGAGRSVVRASIEFGAGVSDHEECTLTTAASDDTLTAWFRVGDEVRASVVAVVTGRPSERGAAASE